MLIRFRTIHRWLIVLCSATCLLVSVILLKSNCNQERDRYEAFLLNRFHEIPDYNIEQPDTLVRPDRPDLAAFHEYVMTVDPELQRVPAERLAKAYEQTRIIRLNRKQEKSVADALEWTGYPSESGGRTRSLMFDPNDPEHKKVWAGSVTGGLWYNEDITTRGSPWIAVNDFWDNLAISCIASDPNNPLIFYVGTGEASTAVIIYRESSGRGSGIFKSTDGGDTWNLLPSTEEFAYVTDIEIRNEGGESVLYAGVVSGTYKGSEHPSVPGDGLYRSADGGETWVQVLPSITGLTVSYAPSDIEISAAGRIFVGTGRNLDGEGAATILYSDEGTTGSWNVFSDYKTIIEVNDSFPYPGRVMLASAPSDATILYALISSGYIRYDSFIGYFCNHILRSEDHGISWKEITLPPYHEDHTWATLAWHALTAAVDPDDPNTLFIGGLDLLRTTDASADNVIWQYLSCWWNKGYNYDPEVLPYVHADQHAIVFRPGSSDEIVFTNDGGVFYTDSGRAAQPGFYEMNTNFTTLQFYTGAIHPNPGVNYYLGGLQDNGTLLYQEGSFPWFIFVSGGDGAFCFIDDDEPWYQITSVYRNLYYFIDASVDWQQERYENFYGTGTFINPADYDSRLNTLFANGMNFTGEFDNSLVVIDHIPENPTGRFVVLNTGSPVPYSHIHVSRYSPLESTTLYLGTQSGRLFRVQHAQKNPVVKDITGINFPVGNISSVAMGGSEDTLLVTFSNYGVESVWMTKDSGITWENKEGNLPDMPVRWSILLPQDATRALLATEIGVWATDDLDSDPVEWVPANNGMANVRVDMLRLRRSDNTILAATHGRGFFTASYKDNLIPVDPDDLKIDLYPNPTHGYLRLSFFCNEMGEIDIKITNSRGQVIISHSARSYPGPYSQVFDITREAGGLYIVTITVSGTTFQKKVIRL